MRTSFPCPSRNLPTSYTESAPGRHRHRHRGRIQRAALFCRPRAGVKSGTWRHDHNHILVSAHAGADGPAPANRRSKQCQHPERASATGIYLAIRSRYCTTALKSLCPAAHSNSRVTDATKAGRLLINYYRTAAEGPQPRPLPPSLPNTAKQRLCLSYADGDHVRAVIPPTTACGSPSQPTTAPVRTGETTAQWTRLLPRLLRTGNTHALPADCPMATTTYSSFHLTRPVEAFCICRRCSRIGTASCWGWRVRCWRWEYGHSRCRC